jgi:hypothetical protein
VTAFTGFLRRLVALTGVAKSCGVMLDGATSQASTSSSSREKSKSKKVASLHHASAVLVLT